MTAASPFVGLLTGFPQGCGDEVLTFFEGDDIKPHACSRTKCPKIKHQKTVTIERKKMKQTQNKKVKLQIDPKIFKYPILVTSLVSSFLLGCATANQSNRVVSNTLEKENVLIEKLKAERAQPEIQKAISANSKLSEAEAHLLMALDEINESNKKMQSIFLKQQSEGDK